MATRKRRIRAVTKDYLPTEASLTDRSASTDTECSWQDLIPRNSVRVGSEKP